MSATTFILDSGSTAELMAESFDLDLFLIDTTAQTPDPLVTWLLDGTNRLFEAFRARLSADEVTRPIAVVFLDTPDDDRAPLVEALFAAVQATALSLAMEYPRTRISVVRAHSAQVEAIRDLVGFLAGDASSYVTAATIDLRSAP